MHLIYSFLNNTSGSLSIYRILNLFICTIGCLVFFNTGFTHWKILLVIFVTFLILGALKVSADRKEEKE